MNKGFFSPIIIALATLTALAMLATVFSATNSNNALLSAVESQKVSDKATDYANALDYALMESLLDSAYSIRGCASAPSDYCALSQTKFGDYSTALSQQLSANSVNASMGVISYPPCSDFKASENLGFSESIQFSYFASPQVYSTLASKTITENPTVIASAFNDATSFGFIFRDSTETNYLQAPTASTLSPNSAFDLTLLNPASTTPESVSSGVPFTVDLGSVKSFNTIVSFHDAAVTALLVEASATGASYSTIVSAANPETVMVESFPSVSAQYIRFTYSSSSPAVGVTKIGAFTSIKIYFASCA